MTINLEPAMTSSTRMFYRLEKIKMEKLPYAGDGGCTSVSAMTRGLSAHSPCLPRYSKLAFEPQQTFSTLRLGSAEAVPGASLRYSSGATHRHCGRGCLSKLDNKAPGRRRMNVCEKASILEKHTGGGQGTGEPALPHSNPIHP